MAVARPYGLDAACAAMSDIHPIDQRNLRR
jgi:hypothetical protein